MVGVPVAGVPVVGAVRHGRLGWFGGFVRLGGFDGDPTAAVIGTVDGRRGGRTVPIGASLCSPVQGPARGDADGRIAASVSVPTGAATLSGVVGGLDILGGNGDLLVAGFGAESRLALVLLDEVDEFGSAGTAAGHDRSGHVLAVLDVDVGVHRHTEQVVGGIAFDDGALTAHAPVVGQADLVDRLPADRQRGHPLRHEHAGFDGRPRGDQGRPSVGFETHLGGEFR